MISTIPTDVLLVEDDVDTRDALSDILELDDYRVATAGSLAEALTDRDWDHVLAVILDRRLPDGTAEDILPKLAEVAPNAAIIIVTGFADVDSAIAALRHGATDYFTKPVQPDRLRNSLSMISARRQAERMFETAINAAPTAMLLVNSDSRIVFANEQTFATFGFAADEVLDQHVEMLIPVEYHKTHPAQFARYVEDPDSRIMAKGRELSAKRKDGTVFPVEVTLTAVDNPGELLILAVVEDITERKRAEALREVEIQLGVARNVQQNLFPDKPPGIKGFDIAGAAFPADATGGDYFDFIPLKNGKVAVVIGDVSGHGIGPAMIMALARSYLRATAMTFDDPGEILTRANSLLSDDLSTGGFMTLLWAELSTDSRSFRYAAAGHNAFVIHCDGTTTELDSSGMVLGPLEDAVITTVEPAPLESGEILLLMTDGVWEAQNVNRDHFGLERTIAFIHEHRDKEPREIIDMLQQTISDFASPKPQADDITAIIARVTG